jgi:alpha-1,2-mannosyltransferase
MYVWLRSGNWVTCERIRVYSWIILCMSLAAIIFLWSYPLGMLDQMGRPKGTDFSNPYSAGKMALNGQAAAAYDYSSQFKEQQRIFSAGEELPFYGWPYPPVFFLIATPLAMLPYMLALLIWMLATFLAYLAMVRSIVPDRVGLLAAAAFPAVFVTVGHGQNAFFTTACLGFGLALIKRHPIYAGIFFGCLCYKPHFGLILPLVLVCGGYWRTFGAASVTVVVLVALSYYFFGWESWVAFWDSQEITRAYVLEQVPTGWEKIQSAFSFSRSLGWDVMTSYVVQACISLPTVMILGFLWFRGANEATYAATAAGALLITPYVLDYDLAVLAICLAFLFSNGMKRGFLPWEKTLLVCIWIIPGVTRVLAMATGIPLGLIGMILIFIWSVYRATRIDLVCKEAEGNPAM